MNIIKNKDVYEVTDFNANGYKVTLKVTSKSSRPYTCPEWEEGVLYNIQYVMMRADLIDYKAGCDCREMYDILATVLRYLCDNYGFEGYMIIGDRSTCFGLTLQGALGVSADKEFPDLKASLKSTVGGK